MKRWITAADAATVLLCACAAWIAAAGGWRGRVAGLIVSVRSPLRLLLLAAVIAGVRHALVHRPAIYERLFRVRAVLGAGAAAMASRLFRLARRALPRLVRGTGPVDAEPCRPVGAGAWKREIPLVVLLFMALVAIMLRAQLAHLDGVPDLGDPLFSIWRLSWIAHQLPRDPAHLFDANIFYPLRNTLAFSDSIVLPGLLGAPFLWVGLPALQVYNLYFVATFVLAAVTMYVLVRSLTGRPSAAVVSATVFAFYPFRFDHYSHFELQFSFWMPLVLLGLHRTLAWNRLRDGLLTGAALACQLLSCIYFGVFLAAYMVPVGCAVALGSRRVRRPLGRLAAGAALAALLVAPFAVPYLEARRSVGERSSGDVGAFSATAPDYLVPNARSTTYASRIHLPRHPERDLFPGLLVLVLALIAVRPPLSAARIAYVLGLVFAFEASLGSHGYLYPVLYHWILPFRGLRVAARYSMLVGLSLSVLAGYGVQQLISDRWSKRWKIAATAALVLVILFESRATLDFEPVGGAHPVYAWFQGRPQAVIAELPTPGRDNYWQDSKYLYLSTFHWQHLLNGTSGYHPRSYLEFSAAMTTFPDEASMALLKARHVDYVVVHEAFYGHLRFGSVVKRLGRRADVREVYRAQVGNAESRIYAIAK